MKSISLLYFFPIIVLFACQKNTESEGVAGEQEVTSTTFDQGGKAALDWAGTYTGVVPCDDCEGIKTTLMLSEDLSYHLRREYIGKETAVEDRQGKFAWNIEGDFILLSGIEEARNKYLVGESMIAQLDENGKRIAGTLARRFELKKQTDITSERNVSLEGTHWMLVELMGEAVDPTTETTMDPFIMLGGTNHYMNAFSGCNNIVGTYTLDEGDGIRFTDISKTREPCPDEALETDLVAALGQTDSYHFSGDTLVFRRSEMELLAMFRAAGPEDMN